MTTQRENLVKALELEIEYANKKIALLEKLPIETIADAFGSGNWEQSWGGSFEFCLPYDFSLISKFKKYMEENWPDFRMYGERQFVWDEQKSAGLFLEYETKDGNFYGRTRFSVAFRSSRNGSTCVLNPIGTKEIPVFEVICADGAKEL